MPDFAKDYELRRYRAALQRIATGEIKGEPANHRDTLAVCRQIAREALESNDTDKVVGEGET